MFWNPCSTQSLVVSCKYWVVPLIPTRASDYSQVILFIVNARKILLFCTKPSICHQNVVLSIRGTPVNIAEGRAAWQSSNVDPVDGLADVAIDGNPNPNWSNQSCSATADGVVTEPPVWAVDLGYFADVYYVEIVNRDAIESKLLSNGWHWFVQIARHFNS